MEQTRKKVIVCAPTGIAAINVGGTTLHRIFRVPIEPIAPTHEPSSSQEKVEKADIIIIDEISMCRFDAFEYVAKSIRMAERESGRKKQVIVVGDFLQLPPVLPDKDRKVLELYWGEGEVKDGFAFQAPAWKEFDFRTIVLDEVVRQQGDIDFVTNLNAVRKGNDSALEWFNKNSVKAQEKAIYICGTNREADEINQSKAAELKGKERVYDAVQRGEVKPTDKPTADTLRLKIGMRVMSIVNSGGYQNGSLGTVKYMSNECVTVEFDNGEKAEISMMEWSIHDYTVTDGEVKRVEIGAFRQLPLKIAYAITIHKSQGQTYDAVNIDPYCFAAGQLYVALSRCRSAEKMHLRRKIKPTDLITSDDVLRFYGYDRAQDVPAPAPTVAISETVEVEEAAAETVTKSKGGKREGSGRKAKYGGKTTTIRVPIEALDEIEALLEKYKRTE